MPPLVYDLLGFTRYGCILARTTESCAKRQQWHNFELDTKSGDSLRGTIINRANGANKTSIFTNFYLQYLVLFTINMFPRNNNQERNELRPGQSSTRLTVIVDNAWRRLSVAAHLATLPDSSAAAVGLSAEEGDKSRFVRSTYFGGCAVHVCLSYCE